MNPEAAALEALLARATEIEAATAAEQKALEPDPVTDPATVALALKGLAQRIDELDDELLELKAEMGVVEPLPDAEVEPLQLDAEPQFEHEVEGDPAGLGEQVSVPDPEDESDPEEKGHDFTDDDDETFWGPDSEVKDDEPLEIKGDGEVDVSDLFARREALGG